MLETERLILRPFIASDAEDVFEYLKEPMVNCFVSMKLENMEEAIIETKKKANDKELTFAIEIKETRKVIGEISAHPEERHFDEKSDTYSPCWMLHKDYHGKGYGYEAAKAVVDYLFREMGARRIYAYTEDYNIASQRVCEKLGMRKEGLFIEFISFANDQEGNPIYENTIQWAILKKEWDSIG